MSGNGDKPEDDSALQKIRDAIKRGQNKGEREEQAAFGRTRKTRERSRAARVKAQKDKKDGRK